VALKSRALAIAKGTFKGFFADDAMWKSAALAYYTVFALAPLLVILLQIASFIWDPAEVRRALSLQFGSLMGQDVAQQVQTMIASAEQKTSGSGLRLVLSIAGLAFGATGAFVSLQTALNQAWKVEPDPKRGGIKTFVTKRVLSLGMVLAIAFLVLVSLALSAALSAAGDLLFGSMGDAVGKVLDFTLSFAVITLVFAAMYKVLPDAKVGWRDVWVGAVATAAFFVVGKYLIGLYIGQSDPGNTFGAAGALAVLLVWIYYAAVIVLLGAEFTNAWVVAHGREIEPEKGAVRVIERKEHIGPDGTREPADDRANSPRDSREESPAAAGAARAGRERSADIGAADGPGNGRKRRAKPNDPDIESAQREIVATRERMSHTIAELDSRVSDAVDDAKEKVSPAELVRQHPWPALAAAVVAGVTLSATRADEKAADVAVDAAKRTSRAAANGASDLAHAAASHLRSTENDEGAGDHEAATSERDGFMSRTRAAITGVARSQLGELEHELRRAADDFRGQS